jgi:hypothetical protein
MARAGSGADPAKPVSSTRSAGDDDDDDDDDRRRGRRSSSRGSKQSKSSSSQVDTSRPGTLVFADKFIAEPNAIALYGYASDVKKVQEFVDRLKEEKHFIENGVYFHINSLSKVNGSQIDNAQIGELHAQQAVQSASQRGGKDGDDDDDDDKRGGGLRSLGKNLVPQYGQGQGRNAGFQVVAFQIELQLYGQTIEFELGDVKEE